MEKIRVLLADDHALFREGLKRVLNNEDDLECIAIAKDGEEAIRLVKEAQPDVALIDIAMPNIDGIDATKQIKKVCPSTAVLIVSAYIDEHYLVACLQSGANGYLLKTVGLAELFNAIRVVHAGGSVFSMEATNKIMHKLTIDEEKEGISYGELQAREVEVLKLVAKGMSNKEVAHELTISEWTVGSHLISIYRKLGVESRIKATLYALEQGWLTVDELH